MLTTLLLLGATLWTSAPPASPPPIRYEVWFPNVVHHEARISVTLTDLPPGPVEFRMSRSSPGRYALHEFAKNVYTVDAQDGSGRGL